MANINIDQLAGAGRRYDKEMSRMTKPRQTVYSGLRAVGVPIS